MTVSEAIMKMIAFYDGSQHDINHFLKVYAFAKTIGEKEKLNAASMRTLELGAVVHDIACPLCREKYGSAIGCKQEEEGIALTRSFFADTDVEPTVLERVVYLVSHHHTLTNVAGLDYQILLEADYLVNAGEQGIAIEDIRTFRDMVFRTETGKELLHSIYLK